MSNFLLVVSPSKVLVDGERICQRGCDLARQLRFPAPCDEVVSGSVRAVLFPRPNGTGALIAKDRNSGSWLLVIGNWFHAQGYGSGDESRLLARVLEVGVERLVHELEGFYVLVFGDVRSRQAVVVTDIVGSCHVFTRSWGGTTLVSSSSLLLAAYGSNEIDPVSCQEFLYTGIIYENRTLYRQVAKIGSAQIMRIGQDGPSQTQCYWQVANVESGALDDKTAVESLGESLIAAAKKIARVYKNPVCDLTGGFDSRAVVSAFLSAGVPFSTTVSGAVGSADVRVAGELAGIAGLPHRHVSSIGPVQFAQVKEALFYTDGEYDMVDYARILQTHGQLSSKFDISVNGSFGEVARGYWWELLYPSAGARKPIDAQMLAQRRYAAYPYESKWVVGSARINLVSHLSGVISKANAGYETLPNTTQLDHLYLEMRMQHWQGRIASSTQRHWPCLSPFLFRTVLESMLRSPVQLRRRSLLIRRLLPQLQPALAAHPLEHGFPALPVTWETWYRFWPIPVLYGEKVLSRVGKILGISGSRLGGQPIPPRVQLWNDEEVQTLLDVKSMALCESIDVERTALADFLNRSRQSDFGYSDQWARVLTVEHVLQTLRSIS